MHLSGFQFLVLLLLATANYGIFSVRKALFNLKRIDMASQAQLDNLTAQVAAETSVTQGAVVLLTGLKASLDAAIASAGTDDGAALDQLSTTLGQNVSTLAQAIAINTPNQTNPAASPPNSSPSSSTTLPGGTDPNGTGATPGGATSP